MAKATDIVKRWKKNNIHPLEKKGDVEKVLEIYGFKIDTAKSGSHQLIITHSDLDLDYSSMGIGRILTLPLTKGDKIKKFYIKDLLKYIELLEKFHGYEEIK